MHPGAIVCSAKGHFKTLTRKAEQAAQAHGKPTGNHAQHQRRLLSFRPQLELACSSTAGRSLPWAAGASTWWVKPLAEFPQTVGTVAERSYRSAVADDGPSGRVFSPCLASLVR
jgi:hypothetical protein